MAEISQAFAAIKTEVERRRETAFGYRPTIAVSCRSGLWDFHYSGSLMSDNEDGLEPILHFLAQERISKSLRSITLDGHGDRDRSNGTLGIVLRPMFAAGSIYGKLEILALEQGEGIILENEFLSYEENGSAAELIAACPNLRWLRIPSAPDEAFFKGPTHPLEVLEVHSGYATQHFITNIAKSDRFPKLRVLRYHDFCNEYMKPEQFNSWHVPLFTKLDEWQVLFRSPRFEMIEEVELSGLMLNPSEVEYLRQVRARGVKMTRSPVAP